MKILILCTGNSCRSQMAEGFLKSFNKKLEVFSAGTDPSDEVHPLAVKVMKDIGIDLSQNLPKSAEKYTAENFNFVITVCGDAKENCPVFTGNVKQTRHIGFDDPADATGTDEFVLSEFIRIRDEINKDFQDFYNNSVKPEL